MAPAPHLSASSTSPNGTSWNSAMPTGIPHAAATIPHHSARTHSADSARPRPSARQPCGPRSLAYGIPHGLRPRNRTQPQPVPLQRRLPNVVRLWLRLSHRQHLRWRNQSSRLVIPPIGTRPLLCRPHRNPAPQSHHEPGHSPCCPPATMLANTTTCHQHPPPAWLVHWMDTIPLDPAVPHGDTLTQWCILFRRGPSGTVVSGGS
jgi:hypothetical protein